MANLEMYEMLMNENHETIEFYNKWSISQLSIFLSDCGIISENYYDENYEIFDILQEKEVDFNKFTNICNNITSIIGENIIDTKMLINIINNLGTEIEDSLKNITNNIFIKVHNNDIIKKDYKIANFNSYEELIKTNSGKKFVGNLFLTKDFLDFLN